MAIGSNDTILHTYEVDITRNVAFPTFYHCSLNQCGRIDEYRDLSRTSAMRILLDALYMLAMSSQILST